MRSSSRSLWGLNQTLASKSQPNCSLKISTKYQESGSTSCPKFSFQISTKLEPQTIDQTSASDSRPNLFQVVFGRNEFSWQNGRLPPIACPTHFVLFHAVHLCLLILCRSWMTQNIMGKTKRMKTIYVGVYVIKYFKDIPRVANFVTPLMIMKVCRQLFVV